MRQAATFAAKKPETKRLTRQVLLRMEKGQIKNPEPELLQALAAFYRLDYQELFEKFYAQRFGVAIERRTNTDTENTTPPVTPSVSIRGEQYASPVGLHDTRGGNIDAVAIDAVASTRLSQSEESAAQNARAELIADFADLNAARLDVIVRHATEIIDVVRECRGPSGEHSPTASALPAGAGGDPTIRHRRVSTHAGGRRKR